MIPVNPADRSCSGGQRSLSLQKWTRPAMEGWTCWTVGPCPPSCDVENLGILSRSHQDGFIWGQCVFTLKIDHDIHDLVDLDGLGGC